MTFPKILKELDRLYLAAVHLNGITTPVIIYYNFLYCIVGLSFYNLLIQYHNNPTLHLSTAQF